VFVPPLGSPGRPETRLGSDLVGAVAMIPIRALLRIAAQAQADLGTFVSVMANGKACPREASRRGAGK
jgi:hypothetical protein